MNIETFTERRLRIEGQKFWFTSMSYQNSYDNKWSNCLYILFIKEDFPQINYPVLVPDYFDKNKIRFNYTECDLANLDWHCGITFYEERLYPDSNKTIVKAGCDFQHLYDDHYREEDYGDKLLKRYTPQLSKEFLELLERRALNHNERE